MLLVCEADYRGRATYEERHYAQGERWRACQVAIRGVDTAAIARDWGIARDGAIARRAANTSNAANARDAAIARDADTAITPDAASAGESRSAREAASGNLIADRIRRARLQAIREVLALQGEDDSPE